MKCFAELKEFEMCYAFNKPVTLPANILVN